MVRVSACPGRSLGTSPFFSTNVSACGHPGTGPFARVQYRVLIMVHCPLGPPLVWTLPSAIIAYGGLFGDITIVEPGLGLRMLTRGPSASLSVDRRVHEVRDPVEARRVPRIRRHEIGDVGKRHAARRIGPGVRGPCAAVPERLGRADRTETADPVALATHMRAEPAVHRNAAHRVVAALPGVAAGDISNQPGRQQPYIAEPAAAEQHLVECRH